MHQYLKSIGFGLVKGKKAQKEVIRDTKDSFTQYDLVSQGEEDFCEYRKEYAPGIGISLYGTLEKDEIFSPDYYCPYLIGTGVTSYADVFVEQRIDIFQGQAFHRLRISVFCCTHQHHAVMNIFLLLLLLFLILFDRKQYCSFIPKP